MRGIGVLAALLAFSALPLPSSADTFSPDSSVIEGNAWDVLAFEGDPATVVFAWGDPVKPRRVLPFAVHNGTDRPIVNGRVTAVMASEEWGEPFTFEDEWVLPLVIEPGEFGIGALAFDVTAFFPEDATFAGTVSEAEPNDGLVDLGTDDLDLSRSGDLEGVVVNTTDEPVGKIEVHAVCLEESGVITGYEWDVLDRRRLDPDQDEDFELALSDNWSECGEYYFATAIGQVRQ